VIANTVGFAIGFGVFIAAFVVLAVAVVRFASRVGRRTTDRDIENPQPPVRPRGKGSG
jgi:uncharacterized membrane protein (DUF485 family)